MGALTNTPFRSCGSGLRSTGVFKMKILETNKLCCHVYLYLFKGQVKSRDVGESQVLHPW